MEGQIEMILRQAGYETWRWSGARTPILYFEDPDIIGFVFIFPAADELLSAWRAAQDAALARYAPAIRGAGKKAWNIYSIFLTAEDSPRTLQRQIEQIEEDLQSTRKIARTNANTTSDIKNILLPILPLVSRPQIPQSDFVSRLHSKLGDQNLKLVDAFVGTTSAMEIANMLIEGQ